MAKKACPAILLAVATLYPCSIPQAKADLVINGNTWTVNTDTPDPWTQTLGTGRNTQGVDTINVNAGAAISVGDRNAISVGDGVTINIDGTVENNAKYGGGLTKEGSGTLILEGENTYTGVTNINEGTLQLGKNDSHGSLASSQVDIAGGATLALDHSNNFQIDAKLTGTGNIVQRSSGRVDFTGNSPGRRSLSL